MPYKHNEPRRHKIPKVRYKISNWREYDEALQQRGSLTVWVTTEALEAWAPEKTGRRGRPTSYSDIVIETAVMLRLAMGRPWRQTEGMLRSIIQMLGLDLPVPDHTTLARRSACLLLTTTLMPVSVHSIAGYSGRSARLRHAACRPRFLKGVIVRVVRCELAKRSGWAKARLLLSTDPTMSAPAIVEAYSRRWSIEPLFRDLKTVDGLGAMWQRGRTALLRWLHLVQIARTLLVLLTARAEPQTLALIRLGGWRPAATLTPGLVKEALASRFRNCEAFRLWPETCRKSGPVRSTGPPVNAVAA
jgi:hypothetical protein